MKFSSQEIKITNLDHLGIVAGIEQRWLLVESEERKNSDLKKIIKNIKKELAELNKQISKIGKKDFESKSIADLELEKIEAKLKFRYQGLFKYLMTEIFCCYFLKKVIK